MHNTRPAPNSTHAYAICLPSVFGPEGVACHLDRTRHLPGMAAALAFGLDGVLRARNAGTLMLGVPGGLPISSA